MKQKTGQSAIDFMTSVEVHDRRAGIEGDQFRCVIVQGLLPNTRQFVVTHEGNDINSLRKWLTVCDAQQYPKKTSRAQSKTSTDVWKRCATTRHIRQTSSRECYREVRRSR